jgi:hypothetical protein
VEPRKEEEEEEEEEEEGADDRVFESDQGLGICLFTTVSRPALGPTQSPIRWVPRSLSLGVKRPGRKVDHSPPSSAEVKNAWSYTSIPPIRLHGVVFG